jgi:putative transposase
MCEVLDITRSTYYDKQTRPVSQRDQENAELKKQIKQIYLDSKRRYGSPKITRILNNNRVSQGLPKVSQKRVQRLMNQLGIKSIVVKKYKPYSKSSVYTEGENILKQDFTTTTINEKWVADITYIYTKLHGWCYLASVEDLHTRKIIGAAFGMNMHTDLVLEALNKAYKRQKPGPGLVFHSDRGTQYTSKDFRDKLKEYKMIQSLSDKGNPYDNACIESFHSIIKKEFVNHENFKSYEEAKLGCFDYIEGWYNRNRIHGSINFLTPNELELKIRNQA